MTSQEPFLILALDRRRSGSLQAWGQLETVAPGQTQLSNSSLSRICSWITPVSGCRTIFTQHQS